MHSCREGHRWQCGAARTRGGPCTRSHIARGSTRWRSPNSSLIGLQILAQAKRRGYKSMSQLSSKQGARSTPLLKALPRADSESDSGDEDAVSADEWKSILLDSLYGTERGLNASSEVRSEISELLTQLEAKNPTPAPTEAIDKLSGKWRLVYTASSELTGLLGLNRVPGIEVGDITQTINAHTLSAVNTVSIQGFGSKTSVSAKAALEIQSPKRVQVRFERTIIESPELVTDAELPSNINFLGQSVDLTSLKESLEPATAYARSKATRLSDFLQKQRNLDIAIPGNRGAQSWLLTTYLDEDLRISRGDKGAIFVLIKDGGVTPEVF